MLPGCRTAACLFMPPSSRPRRRQAPDRADKPKAAAATATSNRCSAREGINSESKMRVHRNPQVCNQAALHVVSSSRRFRCLANAACYTPNRGRRRLGALPELATSGFVRSISIQRRLKNPLNWQQKMRWTMGQLAHKLHIF